VFPEPVNDISVLVMLVGETPAMASFSSSGNVTT
jgi:hypothetical protein